MAIKTNTTQTINRTSSVLGAACEYTQKNLKALCKKAGCTDEEKIMTVAIPNIPGEKDDVLYAGLNGVNFYFMRGESVKMPECVFTQLKNCGQL